MILDPELTITYLALATALALAPGPDTMFVLASGMRHKARGAIAAAFGIAAGSLLHAAAAALGISAVVAASPLAFDLMRYAGAAYLVWLGVQALRAFWMKSDAQQAGRIAQASARQVFLQGFLTNILNPKVIIFYLALLPQFVNVALGRVGLQVFLLGCIHNVIGLVFLVTVGLVAGRASAWITRTRIARWLDGIAGLFFIGLAVRLALTGRPER